MATNILASVSVVLGAEVSEFRAKMAEARKELNGLIKFSDGAKDIGENLSKFVTLPLAAMGAAIVKVGGDFESSFNRVEAATQATGAELLALKDKAKDIALDPKLKFSATDAAGALENLAKNGLNTAQILGGAADATVNLATATGGNLATAADIATDAMNNFNLTANDLAGSVNSITGTTIASKLDIDNYRQALGQAGSVAGQLGVRFTDFNTALAVTSSGFTSGSDAGTSFKTFLQRLVPQSKEAEAAMQQLGLKFFDAQGQLKPLREIAGQLQAAFKGLSDQQKTDLGTKIFGADSIRTALLLAKDGAEGFDKMAASIGKVNAASQGAILSKGFAGALEGLKSATEGLGIAIAESGLLDFAAKIVRGLAEFASGLAKTDPAILNTIVVLAGIAAAVGPVLVAIGTLGVALPALTVGFGLLGTAATATWIAVTGPIGLTVLGIAAVAAGAAVLVNRFGSVEKVAAAFGAAVTNLASKALSALSAGLALTGLPLFAALAAEAAAKVGELAARLGLLSAPTKALAGSFDAAFRQPDYFADELTKTAVPMRLLTTLTDAQRKALEDQLKALQDLNKGYDNIGIRSVLKVPETPDFALKLPPGAGLPTTLQTLPGFDTTALSASVEAARQSYEKLTDSQKNAYQGTVDFNTGFGAAMEQLSASIGPLLADIAGQFGTAFASIVVGTASAGDALATLFGGILQSIGGFMTTFGKQLVVLGIGKVGLDNLFKGAAGGPLAIAAGLGLIALGSLAGAVGSSAASSVSSISSGGGGGNSTRPTFTPTSAPNATAPPAGITRNIHNVVFQLEGNQLVAGLAIETDRLGRITGRP